MDINLGAECVPALFLLQLDKPFVALSIEKRKSNDELQVKTVIQLFQLYGSVFGEECQNRNKQYLVFSIAWRPQANDKGGLPRVVLKKAEELATDVATKVKAPHKNNNDDVQPVLPEPDSIVAWRTSGWRGANLPELLQSM